MSNLDLRQLAAQWELSGLNRRDFLRLSVRGVSAASIAGILAACGGGSTATVAPSAAPSVAPSTAASAAPSAAASTGASAAPSAAATIARTATAGSSGATATRAATAGATPSGGGSTVAGVAMPTPNPAAQRGGTLTGAAVGDLKSFHPFQTVDAPSRQAQGLVYGGGGLVTYDPETLQQVGYAAQKIDISSDYKTVTFTLRDGLKWSDGSAITTDDYIWTYQQVSNPENKYPYLENLDPIVSYTAKDAKTIVVTLKEARTTAMGDADAVTPLPKAVWSKYPWGDPVANPEINSPTVVNGPWKLKEWKKDQSATYVANENFWEGRPYLDSLVVRQYGNDQTAYQALKSGEVDFYTPPAASVKEAEGLSNLTVVKWYNVPGQWQFLGYNLRRPALKDPLVRRAINYAIDRQGIIDAVAYGLGKPIYSAFTQDDPIYNPNVEKYAFDPKKSADLFKQAGYTLQNKKLVKDGQPLKFKLLFGPGTSKVREGIATVTQQQLADLGADVEIVALEFQAYLQTISSEPFDYDLYIAGWSATIDPYYSYQIWSEKSIPDLNAGAYVNKEVDQLFQQSVTEFDQVKRKAIFFKIQDLITNDAPYAFIYNNQSYTALNKRIGGVKPTRQGVNYNAYADWFIQK
jgi:peptide/nickel transport system substrate-binding protein